jgi:hypothetical protein
MMGRVSRTISRIAAAFIAWLALLYLVALLGQQPNIVGIAIVTLFARLPDGSGTVLNSNFVTSIVGALAGAFFGAWGAQKIAAKSKRRDDLLNEIRNTNAAIMVAFTVTNLSLALKKQQVKPLKDMFDQQQLAFAIASTQRRLFGRDHPVVIHFDLRTITPPEFPIVVLQHQVFEKLSVSGRPLALMALLNQSVKVLETSIIRRNELVTNFEQRNERDSAALLPEYLGLPQTRGKINQNYPDFVQAVYATTDDVIFFSLLLGKDLVAHGDKLSTAFSREFGKGAPKISRLVTWHQDVAALTATMQAG